RLRFALLRGRRLVLASRARRLLARARLRERSRLRSRRRRTLPPARVRQRSLRRLPLPDARELRAHRRSRAADRVLRRIEGLHLPRESRVQRGSRARGRRGPAPRVQAARRHLLAAARRGPVTAPSIVLGAVLSFANSDGNALQLTVSLSQTATAALSWGEL